MNRFIFSFFVLLILSVVDVYSQTSTSSPFSRFGLGILNQDYSAEQSALGGSSVVYFNENVINSRNPATYSFYKPKSLLFSTAISTRVSQFSTTESTQVENNTNLSYVSIGMPVTERIFFSSGILPYSDIGYTVEHTESELNFPDVDYVYTGNGGLSNYYIGASAKLNDMLSVGVNASYIFGGLNRNRIVDFNDQDVFNVNATDRTNITGVVYNSGLLFNKNLDDNRNVSFGLTYQGGARLNSRRALLATTYEFNNTVLVVKDTFQNFIDTGSITLPRQISAGLSYYNDKWLFIANYSSQDWSDYQIEYNDEIQSDSLNNTLSLSAGLQYVPNHNSSIRYWERINYRMGARYSRSYLTILDEPFMERSISFGLGLPHRSSKTLYNFSIEIGEKGATDASPYFFSTNTNYKLIKERFIRFSFGVTFKGIWFVKRKYQ